MALVDVSAVPQHVAIIMDGNGRWAQQLGRARPLGHREGSLAVRRTVRAARRLGVRALTLYAFSEQNWERPAPEVQALMVLLRDYLVSERGEILDNEIRLRAVGDTERLPPLVRDVLEPLVRESANNQGMTLTLALSYGGREEILTAARALAAEAVAGNLDPEAIDASALEGAMPSLEVGPVDLLIRTGGEMRISNFLLWSAAYAELYFCDTLWPNYSEADLYDAVAEYQKRNRRFGRVEASVTEAQAESKSEPKGESKSESEAEPSTSIRHAQKNAAI
ncbi:MAG: di-trans,poly-cis-decaprenylcistransferase [Deltaproteobacteria bacterium]|nr:MAG: di-trans,poly-cis-decaprenylcistransferase [Deltaproteobacteria bacterium]